MESEEEKMAVIRGYLSERIPDCELQDGSRTHVDRTLLVLRGATVLCTVQVGTTLLFDNHLSATALTLALKEKDIAGQVLSYPVVYLNHNTLRLTEH